MTPAARAGAAIALLDDILAGAPAEQALIRWARSSRYAGSGDRAAVRDHVYDGLRALRSAGALGGAGQGAPTGRQVMLGLLRASGTDPALVFSGTPHAPAPLGAAELAAPVPAVLPPDMPDWLMPELARSLGADLEPVLAVQRDRAPVFLRVNLQRTTPAAAQAALAAAGVQAVHDPLAATALRVTAGAGRIRAAAPYLDGRVEVQDAASQAAVALLPLRPGMRVLDYCAGGGGKTLAMAGRVGGLVLHAHDAEPRRMADLPVRAARAGVAVRLEGPAGLARAAPFDLVLADVPCSGSGTWRRTPDAKWRLTPDRLAQLCTLQARILRQAAALVAPGGVLAYMTCSLLRRENEDIIAAFRDGGGWGIQATARFLPAMGGDGFFVCVLTRES